MKQILLKRAIICKIINSCFKTVVRDVMMKYLYGTEENVQKGVKF